MSSEPEPENLRLWQLVASTEPRTLAKRLPHRHPHANPILYTLVHGPSVRVLYGCRFDVKLAPLCDPHLPTTSTAGDPYSGGPLSPGDGAFGAPYTPQFGAGVGFPGAGPCGAVPPTPGCPFGGLGLAGGVTGGGPGSGVPHTNSATSYLSRSHTLDSRRVVDAATIGYILNDDALVLGSATLGFKSVSCYTGRVRPPAGASYSARTSRPVVKGYMIA